jgi:hypothetical protein
MAPVDDGSPDGSPGGMGWIEYLMKCFWWYEDVER